MDNVIPAKAGIHAFSAHKKTGHPAGSNTLSIILAVTLSVVEG